MQPPPPPKKKTYKLDYLADSVFEHLLSSTVIKYLLSSHQRKKAACLARWETRQNVPYWDSLLTCVETIKASAMKSQRRDSLKSTPSTL